jgi:ABC-type bacteriocin/lantibiotic exporter with double-glycine peptidase domain
VDIALSNILVVIPPHQRTLFRIRELRIPFGRRILIHGPSGVGKTTLLHLIAGLLSPNEGSVSIGDRPLALLKSIDERRIWCRVENRYEDQLEELESRTNML